MKTVLLNAVRDFYLVLAITYLAVNGSTSKVQADEPVAATTTTRADSTATEKAGIRLAPKAFQAATRKVLPAVVSLEGFGGLTLGGNAGSVGSGPMTGLVISPDGYVLTSTYNFLRKPPVITAKLADGKRVVAKLLGRDDTRKICLLKLEGARDLPTIEIAERKSLRVGQWVIAVGLGNGEADGNLSVGILSATDRISSKAVQTDANLSPVNYGGPLIDLDGKVVGLCVPVVPGAKTEADAADWYDAGIGFAIPLDGLDSAIAAMKRGETLEAGFLGLQVGAFGEPATGSEVKAVQPSTPAADGGFLAGDRLQTIAGTKILDTTHFKALLGRHYAKEKVSFSVLRSEKEILLEVTLGAPPLLPNPADKKGASSGKPAELLPKDQPLPKLK